jgi:predicted Zn-dependent peptidase
MDWTLTTLENDLRVILIPRPRTRTVAVRLYLRAGSRYDGASPGTAHLLEHLLFRGTVSRSSQEIFSLVESGGGEINASTTREYICLYTVTLAHDLPLALDLLADIASQPAFTESDFMSERMVALQELLQSQNQPEILTAIFMAALWEQNPLRYPVRGTLDSLQSLGYDTIFDFYRGRMVSGNALLVVCGDVEGESALFDVREYFNDFPIGPEQPPRLIKEPETQEPRQVHLDKEVNETHLLVGVPTVGMKHPDRSALKVIERSLGMGGSGRLYRRLRAEQQLVYSVQAFTSLYEDAGFTGVRLICRPEDVEIVKKIIFREWEDIRRFGLSREELQAVKGNYAGTLARHFETNLAVAGIFGVEGLLHRVEPFGDAIARIHAVTSEQVLDAAGRYLSPQRSLSATVGRNLS